MVTFSKYLSGSWSGIEWETMKHGYESLSDFNSLNRTEVD